MSLKLYVDLISQPSRALYIFLKVNNIPFEPCLIKLGNAEHLQKAFTDINPFRTVPAIDDNGFKMMESVAIFRYLAKSRKVPDHWYPEDLKLQARVDEYLEWQHTNTRKSCTQFFVQKFLIPMRTKKPVDEKMVAQAETEMVKCLDQIQSIWLKGGNKKFLAGDQISIADLMATTEFEQPAIVGYDVFSKHPIIGDYRERVREKTGPSYEEAHKIVRIMINKFNKPN